MHVMLSLVLQSRYFFKLGGEGMSDCRNVEFLTLMTEDDTASFAVHRVVHPRCQLQISYQIE